MKPVTLVIGATPNPDRYAYRAASLLVSNNHPVIAYGKREGKIGSIEIQQHWDADWAVDTVTLYINPILQSEYYDRIIALSPRRVIFNPGTENPEFQTKLEQSGIEAIEACTLVMLTIGNY